MIESDEVQDDGLVVPQVGYWSADKHELIERYAAIMAKAMQKKWGQRVYLDLYAGAGYLRERGRPEIRAGLPLRALGIEKHFDRYVFNDVDPEQVAALKVRVQRHFPDRNCTIECLDANNDTEKILRHVPRGWPGQTVLTLCVLDPFSSGDLKFSTIAKVAERLVDFIVLVPTGMELNRWQDDFLHPDDRRVAELVGVEDWRSQWQPRARTLDFGKFVLELLAQSMSAKLRYKPGADEYAHAVRGGHTSRRLYHLAFFSRHDRGVDLWQQALDSVDPQRRLL